MQVDCPLGDAPPSSAFEARVVFQDSGLNFNRRIQGGTQFIGMHGDPQICSGIQGNCAHMLCGVGGPLDQNCQPEIAPTCVARICEVDPYCCTQGIAPCD